MRNMSKKNDTIVAISVYLERKKTRSLVGRLMSDKKTKEEIFSFEYDPHYLKRKYAIPLGPELPLSDTIYCSVQMFPSFQDRIPSRENPAYPDYCKAAGISEAEHNPIVLLGTVAKRSASSFIFEPEFGNQFSAQDLKQYREDLGLTIREFSALFGISPSHLHRIESKQFLGKEIVKLIAMYSKCPTVAREAIKANSQLLHTAKYQRIMNRLKEQSDAMQSENNANTAANIRSPGVWADCLDLKEVDRALDCKKALEKTSWTKVILEDKNIKSAFNGIKEYTLFIRKMEKKPTIAELKENKSDLPMVIQTGKEGIWVYGHDCNGSEQLTALDERKCDIDFSKAPQELPITLHPQSPEIYFTLRNEGHHTHFTRNRIVTMKSAFFELRFAQAIQMAGLTWEYECPTYDQKSKNKKSVDFKIIGKDTSSNFLVELTSLRDSDAIKKATYTDGDMTIFSAQSSNYSDQNGIEEREIIKVQNAIKTKTAKFPDISQGTYHIIIVDMRGFLGLMADRIDYEQIAYGMQKLPEGHRRYFLSKEGKKEPIQGVFESNEAIKRKIHAIGFIVEKNYTENEISSRTQLYINNTLGLDDKETALFTTLFKGW